MPGTNAAELTFYFLISKSAVKQAKKACRMAGFLSCIGK